MSDNNGLLKSTLRFLKSQGADKKLNNIASKIISAYAKGHTAIDYETQIQSPLISSDGNSGYLVQSNGKVGLRRLFNQEQFIQQQFYQTNSDESISAEEINKALEKLAPQLESNGQIDWQWQAALSVLYKNRLLLTGGPGTGKTTTLVRMLLLYQELYPNHRIALTAPTGKAAHRMVESVQQNLSSWEGNSLNFELQAFTLHRLLGFQPQSQKLRFNQSNTLPFDLVIVDEASMLDVTLSYGLLKAINPSTKLVLIGDKNQLPAIEAGNVFTDLCLKFQQNQNDAINLKKHHLNKAQEQPKNLANIIELTQNYRFTDRPELVQLCEAVLNQEFETIKQLVASNKLALSNPVTISDKTQSLDNWHQSHADNDTKMILSATNLGFNSVDQLNQLSSATITPNAAPFFQDMPIIITKNLYSLKLSNGDLGTIQWHEDSWQATFDNGQSYIKIDSINHWQKAFAISIHKSQGSEYDHVLITLPKDKSLEILDNKLLYTAISRAKKSVTIWGSEEILEGSIQSKNNRITFLN